HDAGGHPAARRLFPQQRARRLQVPDARRAVRQRLHRRRADLVRGAAGADGGVHLRSGLGLHGAAFRSARGGGGVPERGPADLHSPQGAAGALGGHGRRGRRAGRQGQPPAGAGAGDADPPGVPGGGGAERASSGDLPGPADDVHRFCRGLQAPPEPPAHQGGADGGFLPGGPGGAGRPAEVVAAEPLGRPGAVRAVSGRDRPDGDHRQRRADLPGVAGGRHQRGSALHAGGG
ncbi:hypothetical protein OY671_009041, partial [Metschnikowia pulcherrima]